MAQRCCFSDGCGGFGLPYELARPCRTCRALCLEGQLPGTLPKCRFDPTLHRDPLARNCRVSGRTRLRPAPEIDQVFKMLALKILDTAYEITYTFRYWRNL